MDATSLEKQKKGNLYIYKFGAGSKTPEYQPPTAAAVTKRIISSSVWGLRRSKSKTKPCKDAGMGKEKGKEEANGKGNDEKVKEKEWERERERVTKGGNGRKSVSSVEAILLSLAKSGNNAVEGRKSDSHSSVDLGKGMGFPFPYPQKECKGGGMEGESRKSVSHVENNVAYVGKFTEKARNSTGGKFENIDHNVASSIALFQVKVLVTDMPGFMQLHAFQCARNTYDSLEKFSAKHLASNLKKEFDKVYGPAWHCIVGSSFGSFVTHATGCFVYFSMEKLCILLFRTKVQRAVQQ